MKDQEFNFQQLIHPMAAYSNSKRWIVALSGGLDSTVLLHTLVDWRQSGAWPGADIVAIHVNHSLAAEADSWQEHCQQLCKALDVPLIIEAVTVETKGEGIEAAARSARYQAIEKHLTNGDVLITAHHQDDQSETFLLRLLRGAGTRGLAAMARRRNLGAVPLVRPLLGISRALLADYARRNGLSYCDDGSNRDLRFDRNYLRHQVFPLLEQRWPSIARRWARTSHILAENDQALYELALLDLKRCDEEPARLGRRINWLSFTALSPARRNNLLRHWCEQADLPLPEFDHLETLNQAVSSAKEACDSTIAVQWSGAMVRVFKDRLYLIPSPVLDQDLESLGNHPIDVDAGHLDLSTGDELAWQVAKGGLSLQHGPFHLGRRRGGERCQPQFRQHSQSLKKCLQEVELEPWLRDRVPLIYAGDTLVAVADLWICKGYMAEEDEKGLVFRWTFLS